MKHALREYLIHQSRGSRHRGYGRRYPSRYGHRRRRPGHPLMFGRPRRRTRVHVGGCCLPIPLGMLLGSTAMARMFVRRHR